MAFAQTLREGGWEGRILLISRDNFLPYDKTRLSETANLSVENMRLKDAEWYQHMKIDLKLNTNVTKLQMSRRRLYVEGSSEPIKYSKLFIGTGSRGKRPSPKLVPGVDLKNVHNIECIHTAQSAYDSCKGKTVVIEGSGFVAMELVTTLKDYAKKCYIITRQKRPFQAVLGETVGRALQRLITNHVPTLEFYGFDEIRQIIGNGQGEVKSVVTLKKRNIQCDVVVYAIGSVPNSELFTEDKRTLVSKSSHIVVNEVSLLKNTFVFSGCLNL